MKATPFACLLLLANILLFSCRSKNNFPYAIRDFRGSLQPYLTKAVSENIIAYDHSIIEHATNAELEKLSQSEHPILRAIAFKQMLLKPEFNHFDILMDNLDDTAIVPVDHGEWGVDNKVIADYILENGGWKTQADKNKTIDEVLTKHNRLASAYDVLPQLPPQEKYYNIIKEMALRDWGFENATINALYALAKFKKKEDVAFIKEMLLKHEYSMPSLAFSLMEEFPNDTYLEIYEKSYLQSFYWGLYRNKNQVEGENFIKSVASFKNKSSAEILDTLLNKKVFYMPHTLLKEHNWKEWKEKIVEAISNNYCEAYSRFKTQVDAFTRKRKKEMEEDARHPYLQASQGIDLHIKRDTLIEPIRWGYNHRN